MITVTDYIVVDTFAALSITIFLISLLFLLGGWIYALLWSFIDRKNKINQVLRFMPDFSLRVVKKDGGWAVKTLTGCLGTADSRLVWHSKEGIRLFCIHKTEEEAIKHKNKQPKINGVIHTCFRFCLCVFFAGVIIQWLLLPFFIFCSFAALAYLSRFVNDIKKSLSKHIGCKSAHRRVEPADLE